MAKSERKKGATNVLIAVAVGIIALIALGVTTWFFIDKYVPKTPADDTTETLELNLSSSHAKKYVVNRPQQQEDYSYFYYSDANKMYNFVFNRGTDGLPMSIPINKLVHDYIYDVYNTGPRPSVVGTTGEWLLKMEQGVLYIAYLNRLDTTLMFSIDDNSINFHGSTFNLRYPLRVSVSLPNVSFENPVLTAPREVYKSKTSIIDVDDIMQITTAIDDIDGNITANITRDIDQFTGNGNVVDSYDVRLEVINSCGMVTAQNITFHVVNDFPDVLFSTDSGLIVIENNKKLTSENIVKILVAMDEMNVIGNGNLEYLTNQYEGSEEYPGIYQMTVRYRNSSGISKTYALKINVVEAKDGIGLNQSYANWFTEWGWIVLVSIAGLALIVFIFSQSAKPRYRRRY